MVFTVLKDTNLSNVVKYVKSSLQEITAVVYGCMFLKLQDGLAILLSGKKVVPDCIDSSIKRHKQHEC